MLLSAVYTALVLLVVALVFISCHAESKDPHHCGYPPSSCGNIVNISYPFRLKGDPENCGKKDYELDCEHSNRPVLGLFSGRYYVQAINYNNYTIRLVDVGLQKGNCSSLPLYSLSPRNFSTPNSYNYYGDDRPSHSLPHQWNSSIGTQQSLEIPWDVAAAVWVDCEKPIKSPLYTDSTTIASSHLKESCNIVRKASTSSLISASPPERHSYLLFGSLRESDVADLCRVEEIVANTLWLPRPPPAGRKNEGIGNNNNSFLDFHSKLEYGFELSWVSILCEKCHRRAYCDILSDYSVTCYKYCDRQFKTKSLPCFLKIAFCEYVLPGLGIIVCIMAAWIFCEKPCLSAFPIYKFKRRHLSMFNSIEDFLQSQNNLMPIRYSYFQIKRMTKGFKDKLGEGGNGTVYKATLRSGDVAAIKVLGKSKANGQEFINEVATIGRIHHVNVVRLIGFCVTRSKRALVYEFMPNGSLEKYIFCQDSNISLSCKQMYEISLGVARGIEYLHQGCDMQILHFDIKPHNILLDENFNPKVSDFGLAKLYSTDNSMVSLTTARGTMGYMAPELFYKNIGRVSYKADVYSYGMLLMEMAGRRRNLNAFAHHTSQIYFPSWIYDQFKEEKELEMGENTEEEKKMVRKMVITALWCIQMRPGDRPSMNKVVEMLEGNVETLEMPPKPFLTPQELPAED